MNIFNDLKVSGYVMIPRSLLLKAFEECPEASGDMAAFLRVLTYVNYTEATVKRQESDIVCGRGESVISFRHWSEILGWSIGRTRRFFGRLMADGNIEKLKGDALTHIRIPGYDVWTGKKITGSAGAGSLEASFCEFWNEYHEITHMPRQSRESAFSIWKKLSQADRKMATEHIEDYYFHLRDTKYCRQAAGYLDGGLFRDEYE